MAEDSRPDLSRADEDEAEAVTYCARHPQTETALLCGRCGTPICPRCLVQTPVGARCPTCANVRRLPTVDVKPIFLARGLAAALGAGLILGAAWGYMLPGRGFGLFFIVIIGLAIGYAVGEAVSLATNRKRSSALQACAIVGVVLAYLVHNVVAGDTPLPPGDLWGYLATGVAAVFAAQRVVR